MFAKVVAFILSPVLATRFPAVENGKPALRDMQLIVFSHGLLANRHTYSILYRELASCGYCVVCVTHGDMSADYHPTKGFFPKVFSMWDYKSRNE